MQAVAKSRPTNQASQPAKRRNDSERQLIEEEIVYPVYLETINETF